MEKGNEPATSTTNTSQMAPPYPYPQSAHPPEGYCPPPEGYYPPPANPAASQSQPPPAYPTAPVQYYPGQTQPTVIVQQQPLGVGQYGAGVPPPDYQALAWFACLCCCFPIGLAAIRRSNEVQNACTRGDYASARMASRSARTLSIVSIGLGIAFDVIFALYVVLWLIPRLT